MTPQAFCPLLRCDETGVGQALHPSRQRDARDRPCDRAMTDGRAHGSWPRLVLLRHGVTTAPAGTYLGSRIDPSLSPRGERQARAARAALDRLALSVVVTSPLRRAVETATLAVPPVARPGQRVDDRFREQDMGDYSGLAWAQIKELGRDAARAWRDHGATPPGGESAGLMWHRTLEAALELTTEVDGDADLLIVSHSGPIRAPLASARGLGPADVRRIRIPHGRLRSIRVTPSVRARWLEVLAAT